MVSFAEFKCDSESEVVEVGEVDDITQYTSPLKLFDYLAVGKTIISSDLKVLREIIGLQLY